MQALITSQWSLLKPKILLFFYRNSEKIYPHSIKAIFVRISLMLKLFLPGEAGGSNIDKADGIDSSGFFFQMSVANFGIWVSFTMWIILLTFSLVKLCRYHQEENLRVSMAKERKR